MRDTRQADWYLYVCRRLPWHACPFVALEFLAVMALDKGFHRRPVLRTGDHERRVDINIINIHPGTSWIDKDPRDEWQCNTEKPKINAPWEPKASGLIRRGDEPDEGQAEVASFRGYTPNEFE